MSSSPPSRCGPGAGREQNRSAAGRLAAARRERDSSRNVGVSAEAAVCVSLARRRGRAEPREPAASVCRCVSPCVVAGEAVCVPVGETLRVSSYTRPSTYSFHQVHRRERAGSAAQIWDSWLPAPEPVRVPVRVCRNSEPAHRVPACQVSVRGPGPLCPYANIVFLVIFPGTLLFPEGRRALFPPGSWLTVTHSDHMRRHTPSIPMRNTFLLAGLQQADCKVVARLGEATW